MRGRIGVALVCAALAISGHVGAQSPAAAPPLATVLAPSIEAAATRGARISVVVMEAGSGRVVYEREADAALNPASDAKLLTASAALAILGPDRRFTTTLEGATSGEAVAGPLVLRSDGDPSLSTDDLYALTRELVAAGLRRVDGDLVVDDRALGAEHLPPAFEQQPDEAAPFRAAVGAVSVDENALSIRVRPGTVGAPAVVTGAPRGFVEVENALTTVAVGAPAVELTATPLADGRTHVRVRGTFPATERGAVYRRRLDAPALAAGWALRGALEDLGVRVSGAVRVGPAPEGLATLATHRSAPLSVLLYEVGKDSNNLYAEMTLLAIAAEGVERGAATFRRGAERVVEWCRGAGVDTRGLVVRNGSGLYDANRVSARQLAQALRANWRRPAVRDEFIAQLAVGGGDGTLRHRLRIAGAERMVRAKTGTLDDVIALSGYVLAPDPGRTLVFAILANGVRGRAAETRRLADEIVTTLVGRVRSGR
ncbi:MAG: D-alanyl-D-alanine carboxypeptidase/D-alanyl-D-alanine-endopeptidase [Myxococcaceae bacterium]|nr:D-alanyl-D-alanine carboxypeptidase/D-alanyl-D-alanine-endopeptidase [Myxococcaceae bacterium]